MMGFSRTAASALLRTFRAPHLSTTAATIVNRWNWHPYSTTTATPPPTGHPGGTAVAARQLTFGFVLDGDESMDWPAVCDSVRSIQQYYPTNRGKVSLFLLPAPSSPTPSE